MFLRIKYVVMHDSRRIFTLDCNTYVALDVPSILHSIFNPIHFAFLFSSL